MCFGSSDTSSQTQAASTRQQIEDEAAAREKKIRTGQASIDAAFSAYDQPFYDKYKAASIAAGTPDVENQYTTAKDKLTAALADRGVLNSSIAGNAFGDLSKTRNDALATVASNAQDNANTYRSNVEKQKTDLYNLNSSAADPDAISTRAKGEATTIVAPSQTSTLSNIFSSVLSPLVSYTKASTYSPIGNSFSFAPTSGSGNGKLVS